jgi:hypothetical protein
VLLTNIALNDATRNEDDDEPEVTDAIHSRRVTMPLRDHRITRCRHFQSIRVTAL